MRVKGNCARVPAFNAHQSRLWSCPHCGGSGWSRDGIMPAHDTPHGKSCRASGQISEREARAYLARQVGHE